MDQNKEHGTCVRMELVNILWRMGYPKEFGNAIADSLGGEKALYRMVSYLNHAKPKSAEEIVDEMLAISSEMDAWRKKKTAEYYNGKYNELLQDGLPEEHQ